MTPTPSITEGPVNEDDYVDLKVVFSSAAGPVKQTCDEDELEKLTAAFLNIPRTQCEVRDLFVFAQQRLFGATPGRNAKQLAAELIDMVNSSPLELVGTCLEDAHVGYMPQPSSSTSSSPSPSPTPLPVPVPVSLAEETQVESSNDVVEQRPNLLDSDGNLNSELLALQFDDSISSDTDEPESAGVAILSVPLLVMATMLVSMLLLL